MGLASRLRRRSPELTITPNQGDELLRIEGLQVTFHADVAPTYALRGLDATLRAGRVVGVAGESGSGKTTLALAAMGLLPAGASIAGRINYGPVELLGLKERELRRYRGRHLGMIFQETATALNPVIRVGEQLMMAARAHIEAGRAELRARIVAALADVRLGNADRVMASYPHELSGGQCQRIMIAMALSCGSRVLFADEPTTALDVSIQQEILNLIRELVSERQLALMLISHDLAVLGEVCDELIVMYRGEIVETGPIDAVLARPAHPYTEALLACLPMLHGRRGKLPELPPPDPAAEMTTGCRFRERCALALDLCRERPELEPIASGGDRRARCWRSTELLERSGPDPGTTGAAGSLANRQTRLPEGRRQCGARGNA